MEPKSIPFTLQPQHGLPNGSEIDGVPRYVGNAPADDGDAVLVIMRLPNAVDPPDSLFQHRRRLRMLLVLPGREVVAVEPPALLARGTRACRPSVPEAIPLARTAPGPAWRFIADFVVAALLIQNVNGSSNHKPFQMRATDLLLFLLSLPLKPNAALQPRARL
jgi:hypothetical protein